VIPEFASKGSGKVRDKDQSTKAKRDREGIEEREVPFGVAALRDVVLLF
jgi:hypothetical protein